MGESTSWELGQAGEVQEVLGPTQVRGVLVVRVVRVDRVPNQVRAVAYHHHRIHHL